VLRWLALLLVFLVLPAPQANVSSRHVTQGAIASLTAGTRAPSDSRTMPDCDDDDDQDDGDSVPPAPERSDDDLLFGHATLDLPTGGLPSAVLEGDDPGLRPARGHFRVPEQPPRSA
jgi:hypothetical protein